MVKTFDLQDEQPVAPARKPRNGNGQRRRGKPKNQLDGWIVLDKPIGITLNSYVPYGVVNAVLCTSSGRMRS